MTKLIAFLNILFSPMILALLTPILFVLFLISDGAGALANVLFDLGMSLTKEKSGRTLEGSATK